jgi:hypothetical protein
MTDPNEPLYGVSAMDEEYVIMDREFYDEARGARTGPVDLTASAPYTTGGVSTNMPSWDYGYHELAPRLEREGWYQIAPGFVPIGKRVGNTAHMICPIFEDHRFDQFNGWYLIVGGEGASSRGGQMERYAQRVEETRPGESTLEPSYVEGSYSSSAVEGAVYYKRFPSLGAALDAVTYRDYRGMQQFSAVNPPDGWYDVWLYHWFPLIPQN